MACYVHAPSPEPGCTDCAKEQERLAVRTLAQSYGYSGGSVAQFLARRLTTAESLVEAQREALREVCSAVVEFVDSYDECGYCGKVGLEKHSDRCRGLSLKKIAEET